MNPFIPRKRANLVIVAGNADISIYKSIENLGVEVVPTIKCEDVYDSIAYHPDIVIHPIDHSNLVIAPNVYDYYKDRLSKYNINLIKGDKYLTSKYPGNIAYNVGRLSDVALHNLKHMDPILRDYLENQEIRMIDIKQGYSKCSMAIVDENSVITADYPIYKRLKSLGYDVLLIEPGHIDLENQNYGFIGGATGVLSKGEIMFSGKLDRHPNKEQILKFLKKKNINVNYLSHNPISDIGTIISLYCNKC